MAGNLADRVAIVTGGASGLGRATVKAFVSEGARVVIADIDRTKGQALADDLGKAAIFQSTDVSDARQIQAAVDIAVNHFGGIDVMMNNAGIPDVIGVDFFDLELDLARFEEIMSVNLFGVMVGTQIASRFMAKHGGGSIINTTSIAGIQPSGGAVTYRAAKAGVVMFSQSIALELGAFGVRVNCLAPGLITTSMTNYDPAPIRRQLQPLEREGTPEDLANAAVFLASARSAQITGVVLPVDGGTSVGRPVRRNTAE